MGLGRVVEDGGDADGVDGAALGAREALCGFPEARGAFWVKEGDGDEGGPFGVLVVLGRGEWVGVEMGMGMGRLTRGSVLRTLEGLEEALRRAAILADCVVRIVLVQCRYCTV